MKILITNDDGFDSKLIHVLFARLEKLGHEVILVAPDKNNSCISSAMRFWEYKYNKLTKIEDNKYTHPGTPVDGVYYYFKEFEAPDLVISGINNGLNASYDVLYSGTIGAASEAINKGVPAVAISADPDSSLDNINKGLDLIFDKVFNKKLYTNEYIYSYNICESILHDEIKLCPLNIPSKYSSNVLLKETNYLPEKYAYFGNIGPNTDLDYLYHGFVTCTLIVVDRTDHNNMLKNARFFDNLD